MVGLDITSNSIPDEIEPESVDIVTCIFVLSAIDPKTWSQAVSNIHKMLRPGGTVLFRDYGRYDLAQLRFKAGRCLTDNFYVRGDGTRVYFFTNDELDMLFDATMFTRVLNTVDRRLIVNRSKKLKMYRSWINAKFQKVTMK